MRRGDAAGQSRARQAPVEVIAKKTGSREDAGVGLRGFAKHGHQRGGAGSRARQQDNLVVIVCRQRQIEIGNTGLPRPHR